MRQTRPAPTLRRSWTPVCLAFALALLAACGEGESKQAKAPEATAARVVGAVPSATGEPATVPASASPVSDDQPTTATSAKTDAASTETLAAESDTVADDIPSTAPRLVLSGRVMLQATGEPAKGATVELVRFDNSSKAGLSILRSGSATTDANGRYRMTVQDSSYFRVMASKSGAGRVVDQLMRPAAVGRASSQSSVRKVEKDFVLPPGMAVAGTVIDEEDRPVKGIKVVACAAVSRGQSSSVFYTPASETITDAEGRFRFDETAAGSIGLTIDSEDYVPVNQEVTAPTNNVVLRVQSEGGSLSGYVYLKSTGAAVPGADVFVHGGSRSPRNFTPAARRPARTGADGSFRFDRLAAGDYWIVVSKAPLIQVFDPNRGEDAYRIVLGEKEKKLDLTYFLYAGVAVSGKVTMKDTGEPVEGAVVKPAGGQRPENKAMTTGSNGEYRLVGLRGPMIMIAAEKKGLTQWRANSAVSSLDVSLESDKTEFTRNIEMTRAVTVSGTVKTESGAPVPDAQVTLLTQNWTGMQKKTLVEADGTYTLDTDPFSSLRVKAEAPGYPMGVSESVAVQDVSIDNVDVVLKRGGTVSGVVTMPDGKPAAGATVAAQAVIRFGNTGTGERVGMATTDGAGTFLIANLPDFEVSLSATQQGFASSQKAKVTLLPGEVKLGIALQLRTPHYIAGRVTDKDNNPVVSVHVQAYASGGYEESRGNAQTDADGRYRIEGLADVSHFMSVWGSELGNGQKQNVAVDQDNVDFVLGAENNVTLIGTVIDATTKEPIADFAVAGRAVEKDPDTPGRFTLKGLRGGVSSGLRITAPGYADCGGDYLTVPEDVETFEKTFEMGKGGSVTGRVVEKSSGNPLAGVRVLLRGVGSDWEFRERPPVATANTGDDGLFQFANVSAGTNTIEFHPAKPLIERSVTAVVEHEKITDLGDLPFGTGAKIHGRVVRALGNVAAPGVTVRLSEWASSSSASKETTTNNSGEFDFDGLAKGSCTLSVSESNLRVRVDVGQDDTRDVVLRIGGCSVSGRVIKNGKPIPASLTLSKDSYHVRIDGSTDDKGHYEFAGLDPGNYLVDAFARTDGNDHLYEMVALTAGQALEKDLVFPEGGISGRVVDADGNPVAGAQVIVRSVGGLINEGARSGEDGTFRVGGLRPDTYTVTASRKDGGMATRDAVEVPKNGDAPPVELRLDSAAGGTIVSVVLDMEGKPIQAAWCYLTPPGGSRLVFGIPRGADGVLKLVGVPAGTYDVEVSYWGHSIVTRAIEVKAGEEQTFEDVLYKAGALRWTLTDKDGNILTGVPCHVVPNDPASIEDPRDGQTDSNGCLIVRGLYPGDYTGTATHSDGRSANDTFTIRVGELTNKTSLME